MSIFNPRLPYSEWCVCFLCMCVWCVCVYVLYVRVVCVWHWRKSRGGWGGCIPPHFFGWGGWPVQTSPPLFEDKITLNLTFIVKKLTFLTVKLLKPQKNRSLAPLAHTQMYSETRSLRFCQYCTCILFLTSFM